MEAILSELRLAARSLRRTPAITIAALITLAIGIGANSAVFSVVDGLLLRPLPYPDPGRLGLIWIHSPGIGIFQDWPSPGHFLDIKAQNRSFEDIAIVHGGTRTMTGGEEPVRLDVLRTSSTLFTMLGAQPLMGRLFTADDDAPGPPDALLSPRRSRRIRRPRSSLGLTSQKNLRGLRGICLRGYKIRLTR
jgi:hypothetical protein